MDRIQTIGRGSMIFKERCCRVSYGVRCREEYSESNKAHVGQKVVLDPRDGKRYVENQIDWFVKQVSSQSILTPNQEANADHSAGRKRPQLRLLKTLLAQSETRPRRPPLENQHHNVHRTPRTPPHQPRPRRRQDPLRRRLRPQRQRRRHEVKEPPLVQ